MVLGGVYGRVLVLHLLGDILLRGNLSRVLSFKVW